jgi:predicted acetyltransferase
MELIKPNIDYKNSFLQAVQEFQSIDPEDRNEDYTALNIEQLSNNFSEYVSTVISQSEGKNLPEGYVPQSNFWLVDKNEFIGRVSIRHSLTDHLLKEGGHIGYDIRPSKRRLGYGKKILELSLLKAKELGIQKVLVTCDETNIGSKKIIEANSGILENSLKIHEGKPKILRYWISL